MQRVDFLFFCKNFVGGKKKKTCLPSWFFFFLSSSPTLWSVVKVGEKKRDSPKRISIASFRHGSMSYILSLNPVVALDALGDVSEQYRSF